jgi:CheY-like chemotaxis protein
MRGDPAVETATEAAATTSGDDLVALVVDDEPVVRADVARALTLAGIEVALAANGREAFRLVAEDRVRPAVVVTDIEMPGLTGIELAARLLALRPAIRIVMMTADPDRAEAARRHPSIVDRVLMKPVRVDDLVSAVRPEPLTGSRAGSASPSGRSGERSPDAKRGAHR